MYTNGFRWCTFGVHLVCSDDVLPGKRGETVYTIGVHGRSHILMALTLRARLSVRMSLRPAGALYSFALSRPQGAVLVLLQLHPQHHGEPQREVVISR